MSAMETDINAPPPPAPAGEGSSAAGPSSSTSRKPNKRFEIKKWNAVALWAWGTSARPSIRSRFSFL
jgi:RING-box protein 1